MPSDYDCSWNGLTPSETFKTLFGDNCVELEKHMFMKSCLSDETIGGIVVGLALFFLFVSVSTSLTDSKTILKYIYIFVAWFNCKNVKSATGKESDRAHSSQH